MSEVSARPIEQDEKLDVCSNAVDLPLAPQTLKGALKIVRPYAKANAAIASFQVISTSLLFAALIGVMLYIGVEHLWATLLLAIPAGLVLLRIFTLQHDCGHGSLFGSRVANNFIGSILAFVTLTPYQYWRAAHAIHHTTTGNLDKRGTGDIETLTIREYAALSLKSKIGYRLIRNPFFLFGLGSILHFAIKQRLPVLLKRMNKKYLRSVHKTNLALVLVAIPIYFTYGIVDFLIIYIPVAWFAAAMGFWLFYVQHSFHDTYWSREEDWDYRKSAVEGSSLIDMPPILRWISADIGIHHIHHLLPAIPNYQLRPCYEENPSLCNPKKLGFKDMFTTLNMSLWDEDTKQLVPFRKARKMARMSAAAPTIVAKEPAE